MDHVAIPVVTPKLLATAANQALVDLVKRDAARTAACPRVTYAALAAPTVQVAPLAMASTAPMAARLVVAALTMMMMMMTTAPAVPAAPAVPVALKVQAALLRLSMVFLLARLLLPLLRWLLWHCNSLMNNCSFGISGLYI